MQLAPQKLDPFQAYVGKRVLLRHSPLIIERSDVQGGELYFYARREGGQTGCWLRLHQVLNGLEDT